MTDGKGPVDEETRAVLLKEYEVCQRDAAQLDTDIWRSGTFFMTLSLLGLAVLLRQMVRPSRVSWINLFIAMVGIFVNVVWLLMVRKWFLLLNVAFYRMGEIESCLGMYYQRYIDYVEGKTSSKEDPAMTRVAACIRASRPLSIEFLLRLYVFALLLCWAALAIHEAMLLWNGKA